MTDYISKLFDSSRSLADMIVSEIGNDQAKFTALYQITELDKYPVSMRAARIIQLAVDNSPALVIPHLPAMIDRLPNTKVDGVKRAYLKILMDHIDKLNEDAIGIVTDQSFSWLADKKQAIAIRMYAMEILLKVIQIYPDLKNELTETLEQLEKEELPSMQQRFNQVLKELRK